MVHLSVADLGIVPSSHRSGGIWRPFLEEHLWSETAEPGGGDRLFLRLSHRQPPNL